jgi:hypothetical protein
MKNQTQSVNGPEPITESAPVSELVSQKIEETSRIIEHPDVEQLDPEMFRVDQSALDQQATKKVLTVIPVRRPGTNEFFRVHPDPAYSLSPVYFINLKQNREYYIVAPGLRSQLRPKEYSIGQLFLAIDRLDNPFFWLVTTQSPTGRVSEWYLSSLECALRAKPDWISMSADQAAGGYVVTLAEDPLPEPIWPEQSFKELFDLAFKRRFVTSVDHAVFNELRGRA